MKTFDTLYFLVKYVIALIFFGIFALILHHSSDYSQSQNVGYNDIFADIDNPEIDSLLADMTLDEKLAQLIFYEPDSLKFNFQDSVYEIISKVKPGGLLLCTDSLSRYLSFKNQSLKAGLISPFFELESQTGMPDFKDVVQFPSALALDAVSDDSLKLTFYKSLADFHKLIGNHINFVDLSTPENDSIQVRDYLIKLKNLIRESQSDSIILMLDRSAFFQDDSLGFIQNQQIIETNIAGITTNISKKSKSKYHFETQLRSDLNFGGLYFVHLQSAENRPDSLLKYLQSGADMFRTKTPEILLENLKNLIANEKLSEQDIDKHLRRIIAAKFWTGIKINVPESEILSDSLILETLNSVDNQMIADDLFAGSISLIKNKEDNLPVKSLLNKSIRLYVIGEQSLPRLETELNKYYSVSSRYINLQKLKNYKFSLKNKTIIIALNHHKPDSVLGAKLHDLAKNNNLTLINFGKPKPYLNCECVKSVLLVYGSSEAEQKYAADAIFGGLALSGKLPVQLSDSLFYGKNIRTQKIRLRYALPEQAGLNSGKLAKIDSIMKDAIRRRAFPGGQVFVAKSGKIVYEKSFGYHSYYHRRRVRNSDVYDLASVTKIAATTTAAMKMYDMGRLRLNDKLGKYFKDTKIDYSDIEADTIINIDTLLFREVKDFEKLLKVQDTLHISDSSFIAFDTIIVTATPSRNIFKSVRVRDLLMHKSGISPVMPILPYLWYKKYFYDSLEIYKSALHNSNLVLDSAALSDSSNIPKHIDIQAEIQKRFNRYFSNQYIKDSATVRIAKNFYLQDRYFDTLWRDTKRLPVYSRKIYQYSDVNMILLQQAMDSLNNQSLDRFLKRRIYAPMGLSSMTYKAWKYTDKARIIPTENDKFWRGQLLKGDVHDPSAALMGGISGNAGLFSTAHDLGILGQMWLNGGTYGGLRFISSSTLDLFTATQEGSHRGLGFDKATKKSITGHGTPPSTFGHTGFTGTCIWVDKKHDLVYVFLSNRVNPKQTNWRINRYKVRQKVHTAIYEAME